jgi:hypothetical protein
MKVIDEEVSLKRETFETLKKVFAEKGQEKNGCS